MTTKSFNEFLNLLDPVCLKVALTKDEYDSVKKESKCINATVLYTYYKTMTKNPVGYADFYKELKANLYYDKYICKHGTEFVYYVKGKDEAFSKFIESRETLGYKDAIYVWRTIWNG